MSLKNALQHARRSIAVTAAVLMLTAIGTLVGAAPQYSISQKGREFHPDRQRRCRSAAPRLCRFR
jgi:hypothetical protein